MIWSIFSFGSPYPEARVSTEDGFVDIKLSVAKREKTPDGDLRLLVRSSLNGKRIGFALDLKPEWKASEIEGSGQYVYWGNAAFIRTGTETDRFVYEVARLYGLEISPTQAKKVVPAQVVGLAGNPANIESEPVRMKLFFNAEAEEDLYSEVFINVDLANNFLEFNEKNEEYRDPLINSLAEQP